VKHSKERMQGIFEDFTFLFCSHVTVAQIAYAVRQFSAIDFEANKRLRSRSWMITWEACIIGAVVER